MIFSPEQAAKLLCPMVRASDGTALACRANACAWWRWADQTSERGHCAGGSPPEVYRLQSGDYPIRRPHTILTTTTRTVDQGTVPEPVTRSEFNRAIAEAMAEDAARDLAAGRF